MRAASMVAAGKRNIHGIVEYDASSEKDSAHQPKENWVRFCEAKFSMRQLQARETQYGGGTYAVATHMLTTRGNTDTIRIKPSMRVRLISRGGRILHVYAVENVEERNREIQLWCGEQVVG